MLNWLVGCRLARRSPCGTSKQLLTCLFHCWHRRKTCTTGGANCVLGSILMRDLLGFPWLYWLLPVVCSLGVMMLVGMMLEVPRMRRVREVSLRAGCCCNSTSGFLRC